MKSVAQGSLDFGAQSASTSDIRDSIFRPVQYLGSKLRALEAIVGVTQALGLEHRPIVDAFSGSSVVSQALAANGNRVIANDTQPSCHAMAFAMLGVARSGGETLDDGLLTRLTKSIDDEFFFSSWRDFVEREDRAVSQKDSRKLNQVGEELPLSWRAGETNEYVARIPSLEGLQAFDAAPLFSCTFAGTYFGVRQSLTIDALRVRIERLYRDAALSEWQYRALLTGLMTAASKAVYSAGKHFAQPLTAGKSRTAFRSARLLQDRAVGIGDEFIAACKSINNLARPGSEGHAVFCSEANQLLTNPSTPTPAAVYADPPYTAQQYSRFYHVLDTLVTYEVSKLSENGRVTSGLYPANRYKSAFSSKRSAPDAFQALLTITYRLHATLLLSYSDSHEASNGNVRMISLDRLLEMCRTIFGKERVEITRLEHSYRQFNSESLTNKRRNDPELLIVCRC